MRYLSLRSRVPEVTALESRTVTRFYSLIRRLPVMHASHRRFVAGVQALGVATGNCLDLGTGPGSLALAIASRLPALRIIGLDLSAPMLEHASGQSPPTAAYGRALWSQGDGHYLPFASRSFDLVVSSFALHHWAEPVQILDEIARVLRPGGRYYIADICREANLSQRLFAWGSVPFVSLPLGSYRGYGGYYESLRASYTRTEATRLLEHSALPPGRVEIAPAGWIPTLTIASLGPYPERPPIVEDRP